MSLESGLLTAHVPMPAGPRVLAVPLPPPLSWGMGGPAGVGSEQGQPSNASYALYVLRKGEP